MFSLVADYGDSEGSSLSDLAEADSKDEPLTDERSGSHPINTNANSSLPACSSLPSLPSASDMLQPGTHRVIPGSVFSNPFREAEEAKLASLEKHVKMVDPEANVSEQKRKVCWSYKKGRCRFGSKCNFAHDSDLILRKELPSSEHEPEEGPSTTEVSLVPTQQTTPNKKKRPGLSRELVPPRKVLKMYHREKYGMLK